MDKPFRRWGAENRGCGALGGSRRLYRGSRRVTMLGLTNPPDGHQMVTIQGESPARPRLMGTMRPLVGHYLFLPVPGPPPPETTLLTISYLRDLFLRYRRCIFLGFCLDGRRNSALSFSNASSNGMFFFLEISRALYNSYFVSVNAFPIFRTWLFVLLFPAIGPRSPEHYFVLDGECKTLSIWFNREFALTLTSE